MSNAVFTYSSAEILSRGMECLVKNLGIIEAETFVATLMRERFDILNGAKIFLMI